MPTLNTDKPKRQYKNRSQLKATIEDYISSKPIGFTFKLSDLWELFKNNTTLTDATKIYGSVHSMLNLNSKVEKIQHGVYVVKGATFTTKQVNLPKSNIAKVKQLLLKEITKSIYMRGEEYYIERFILSIEQEINRKLNEDEVSSMKDFLDNSGLFSITSSGGYILIPSREDNKAVIETKREVKNENDYDNVSADVYEIFLNGYLLSNQKEIFEELDPFALYSGLTKYLKEYPSEVEGIEITKNILSSHSNVKSLHDKYYFKRVPMLVELKFQ